MCVLSLISKKDWYGYGLVEEISRKFEISEGTIYPLLRRLTKEELFFTYLLESSEGPPRKYYKITPKGLQVKNELVAEWKEFTSGVNEMIEED